MKWLAAFLLLAIMATAAVVEVKDWLGFPISNATVCVEKVCVTTNKSGVAEVSQGWAEVYIDGVLAWRTYATGREVALIRPLEVKTYPLKADGRLVVKMVKFLNGTYRDVGLRFNDSSFPVGNVNYEVEIKLDRVDSYVVNATIKATLFNLEIDLEKVGIVRRCDIKIEEPVRELLWRERRWVGTATFYLIAGGPPAVARTDVVLPNGTSYSFVFNPADYCQKSLHVNATRLTVMPVDSFGVVRYDWSISVAGRTFKGVAQLWVLSGLEYRLQVYTSHMERNLVYTPTRPVEVLYINLTNAYLELSYSQPPRRVYIFGNQTVVDYMPKRVELPPGLYRVVIDFGSDNVTYLVELKPGEVVHISATPPPPQGHGVTPYIPIAVALAAVAITTLLRRLQARGPSRS
ncbi:MAG: hypothetical protein ACK4M3_03650 [Pyrobaculum sp.]